MEIKELHVCIKRIIDVSLDIEKEKQKASSDLKTALEHEDVIQQAYAYQRLFACSIIKKDTVDARYYKAYATQYAIHLDEPALLLINHQLCGLFYLDEEEALEYDCKALMIAKKLQDVESEARILYDIATIFDKRKDCKAKDFYERSMQLMDKNERIYPLLMAHLFTLYTKSDPLFAIQFYDEHCSFPQFSSFIHAYLDILYLYACRNKLPFMQLESFLKKPMCDASTYWMLEELYQVALQIKDQKHAKQILMLLCENGEHDQIQQLLKIQDYVISYSETFPCAYDQSMLYQDYVHLSRKLMIKKDAQISHRYEEKLQYYELLAQNQILKQQASYDEVTKLRNRQRFQIDIEEMMQLESIQSIGIAMCDIDNFKEYNDTYGHLFGDQIIRKMADILQSFAYDNITIYRFGGDEFLCMFVNKSKDDISCYLTEIFIALEKLPQKLHISAGYTCLSIECIQSLKEMIHHADTALYQAKNCGKNQFMEYVEQEA